VTVNLEMSGSRLWTGRWTQRPTWWWVREARRRGEVRRSLERRPQGTRAEELRTQGKDFGIIGFAQTSSRRDLTAEEGFGGSEEDRMAHLGELDASPLSSISSPMAETPGDWKACALESISIDSSFPRSVLVIIFSFSGKRRGNRTRRVLPPFPRFSFAYFRLSFPTSALFCARPSPKRSKSALYRALTSLGGVGGRARTRH
jgi:hypothetical protein